ELTTPVLVTGGAGFIGSNVVDVLLATGHEVAVGDDLSTGSRENLNPGAEFHHADITDPDIDRILASVGPDVICHNAAQISVSVGQSDPVRDLDINGSGTLRLLEYVRQAGCRFVHASSAALYGDTHAKPEAHGHPTQP